MTQNNLKRWLVTGQISLKHISGGVQQEIVNLEVISASYDEAIEIAISIMLFQKNCYINGYTLTAKEIKDGK